MKRISLRRVIPSAAQESIFVGRCERGPSATLRVDLAERDNLPGCYGLRLLRPDCLAMTPHQITSKGLSFGYTQDRFRIGSFRPESRQCRDEAEESI